MARQIVNVGTQANNGTGDTVRAGFIKLNAMSDEIYNAFGDGTNLNGYVATDVTGGTYKIGVWRTLNDIGGEEDFIYDYDADKVILTGGDFVLKQPDIGYKSFLFTDNDDNVTGFIASTDTEIFEVKGPKTDGFSTERSSLTIQVNGTVELQRVLADNTVYMAVADYDDVDDLPSDDSIVTKSRMIANLSSLLSLTTDDVAEASNLYFTEERVDDQVASLIQAGAGIGVVYNDAGGTLTISIDEPTVETIVQDAVEAYLIAGDGIALTPTGSQLEIAFDGLDINDYLTAGTGITITPSGNNAEIAVDNVDWDGGEINLGIQLQGSKFIDFYSTNASYAGLRFDDTNSFSTSGPGMHFLRDSVMKIGGPSTTTHTQTTAIYMRVDGTVDVTVPYSASNSYVASFDYTSATDLPSNDSVVTKGRINSALEGVNLTDVTITRPTFAGGYRETPYTHGNSSASSFTLSIDPTLGNVQTITLRADMTIDGFSITGGANPLGYSVSLVVLQDGTGGHSFTPGANLHMAGGDTALNTAAGGMSIITLYCLNTSVYLASVVRYD